VTSRAKRLQAGALLAILCLGAGFGGLYLVDAWRTGPGGSTGVLVTTGDYRPILARHGDAPRILLSRTGCPFCDEAKAFLAEKKIPYVLIEGPADPRAKALGTELQVMAVPVLVLPDRHLFGFDPTHWDAQLRP
jgi:glutaredoxin